MLKKTLFFLKRNLFYIWLLFFTFLTLMIYPKGGIIYGFIGLYSLYLLIYRVNRKIFFIFIGLITFSLSLYYPIYLTYGKLNSGIIAAFLETNQEEVLSFLGGIKWSAIIAFPFLFLISAVILFRLEKYNSRENLPSDVKSIFLVNIILLIAFVGSSLWWPIQNYIRFNDDIEEPEFTLSISPVNAISFYIDIYESIKKYYSEKAYFETAAKATPPWQILSVKPNYINYVLIIGESARRDYLSTYGFSLPTTPFLDKTNGYINAGYISAAPATYHSLMHTLYFRADAKRDYSYNIISLAKAAGIKTIWLSNQGSMGKYDTIASRIGVAADQHIFTKKGGYNTNKIDDSELLLLLKAQFDNKVFFGQSKLFVLHLMGSHTKFCDRLNKDEHKYIFLNENLSCYVNTIVKNDKLIENVVELLKAQHESYSLLYFSDHGLAYKDKTNIKEINLDYNGHVKQSYEVPFFKISSDDSDRKMVNVQRSAFNFIYGFSQWLGIETKELDKNYDFFSDKPDDNIQVFDLEKYERYDELEDDKLPKF